VFHKEFKDAIEEVAIPTGSTQLERTWRNTDGVNTGVELEVRKSLGFIGEFFQPVTLAANYTWLDSRLDLASAPGKRQRRLQGQSPYLINAGLYYDNLESGTSASIAYNRIGERISSVSTDVIPDLVEQPRDRLDLSFSQTFFTSYELKLVVKDLLAQDLVVSQVGKPSRVDQGSTSVTLGLSLKF
jgi:outer membrane receptor protein involved in Fe transport